MLKTIKHVYATRLCTGLRRSIGPAVARVLQNDQVIAASRPLFQDYVRSNSTGSGGAVDMDVLRLENLITPLVQNTEQIEHLLNDSIYPRRPQSDTDRDLLRMREHLASVLAQQKQALDLISGFVDTQQMGELKAAGNDYNKAITGTGTTNSSDSNNAPPVTSPTTAPADILNAGVNNPQNDPAMKYDPRFQPTGSQVGYNPLNVFDQQMNEYQQTISQSETLASQAIFKAVPQCGGQAPGASPAPEPATPTPRSVPFVLSSPSPKP
jgi:hypothetical protein